MYCIFISCFALSLSFGLFDHEFLVFNEELLIAVCLVLLFLAFYIYLNGFINFLFFHKIDFLFFFFFFLFKLVLLLYEKLYRFIFIFLVNMFYFYLLQGFIVLFNLVPQHICVFFYTTYGSLFLFSNFLLTNLFHFLLIFSGGLGALLASEGAVTEGLSYLYL